MVKRMRVFAGPNGSGKTTIIKSLQGEICKVYLGGMSIRVKYSLR